MGGAYLTDPVAGAGGRLRVRFEDFRVEEIPLVCPSGDGEHLYLWVEKRGISTIEAMRALCRSLNLTEAEAGYAGLKDANAVARQWFSFRTRERGVSEAILRAEDAGGVRVLEKTWSRTKIRRSALLGNRFEIFVREVVPGAERKARAVLDCLAARGLPNAYGDQRFGVHGHTARIGFALAKGDWRGALCALLGTARFSSARNDADERLLEAARRYEAGEFGRARRLYPASWMAEWRALSRLEKGASPEQAVASIPPRERTLYGGAFQAAVFNSCLARRLEVCAHDRVWAGDVLFHHETSKVRRVGAPDGENGALSRFEVSPAGPLLGRKMLEARAGAEKLERSVLESLGVDAPGVLDGLERLRLYGARRPYRAQVKEVSLKVEGGGLRIGFTLPPGAYASEVLREVMKSEPPVGAVARIGGAG